MVKAIEKELRILALRNAVLHSGKAEPKAVIGRIMAMFPEMRKNSKKAMELAARAAELVNSMSPKEQAEELKRLGPQENEAREERRKDIFSALGIRKGEKIVTAFPPGPEKYPHIGHAKALLFNYLIAKRNNGSFILRFEDTNPKLVKNEFYLIMQEDFRWLGVEWDSLMYASDSMELFYDYCRRLISSREVYICTCSQEKISESRAKGKACGCRSRKPEANLKLWDKMAGAEEGSMVARLRIDLKHSNSTMRDPTIFRIIDAEHARQGKKYRIWPNYDFQNAIMDGHFGVTHRVRSKEFEMRNELQRHIQNRLGLAITKIFEFARFNIEGVESSGRKIRELIEQGKLLGWDDPSLTTIAALRRRGFLPDAIREFLLRTGMTKSEATLTWDDLIMHNKRLLDRKCSRMFFVAEPVRVEVEGAPEKKVMLKKHPDFPDWGCREMETRGVFYLQKSDLDAMKEGGLYRLMDCYNVRRKAGRLVFDSESLQDFRKGGSGIIHYIPEGAEHDEAEVLMPDHSLRRGICESISGLDDGSMVQFERFGFVRLDSKKGRRFWFTHG